MPPSRTRSNQNEVVKILVIGFQLEAQAALRQVFDQSNWSILPVSGCGEAVDYLGANDISVVICERDLPDGDWRLVLNRLDSLPNAPTLIVTSRQANHELWAEVLNLGGYDVLAQPFDAQEVSRVVCLARDARRRCIEESAERKAKSEAAVRAGRSIATPSIGAVAGDQHGH